jgi:hypothetical protein
VRCYYRPVNGPPQQRQESVSGKDPFQISLGNYCVNCNTRSWGTHADRCFRDCCEPFTCSPGFTEEISVQWLHPRIRYPQPEPAQYILCNPPIHSGTAGLIFSDSQDPQGLTGTGGFMVPGSRHGHGERAFIHIDQQVLVTLVSRETVPEDRGGDSIGYTG